MDAEEAMWRWRYEPATGLFFHNRHDTGKGIRRFGRRAGSVNPAGYVVLRVGRPRDRLYQAHRIAWLITHGRWPAVEIDHVNGVKDDNRLDNLREATIVENNYNNGGYRGDRTLKGAYQNESGNWYAAIRQGKKLRYLGLFESEAAAHGAYCSAAIVVAGEFARFD